jgi:hypothetical protein
VETCGSFAAAGTAKLVTTSAFASVVKAVSRDRVASNASALHFKGWSKVIFEGDWLFGASWAFDELDQLAPGNRIWHGLTRPRSGRLSEALPALSR